MFLESINRSKILVRDLPTRSVTFGPSRATVIREINNVSIQPGANEIVIYGLDSGVERDSIKVDGKGPATITDMTTEIVQNQEQFEDIYGDDSDVEDYLSSDVENDYGVDHADLISAVKEFERLGKDLEQAREQQASAEASQNILKSYGDSVVAQHRDASELQTYLQVREQERTKNWEVMQNCKSSIQRIENERRPLDRKINKLQKEFVKRRQAVSRNARRERKRKNSAILQRNEEKRKQRSDLKNYWPHRVCQTILHVDGYGGQDFTPQGSRRNSIASSATVGPSRSVQTDQPEKGAVNLVVSYVVHGSSWSPRYELSLSTLSKSGKLAYRAEFQNATSETWQDASITLSTFQTTFSGIGDKIPKLEPWNIRLLQGGVWPEPSADLLIQPRRAASVAPRKSIPLPGPPGAFFGGKYMKKENAKRGKSSGESLVINAERFGEGVRSEEEGDDGDAGFALSDDEGPSDILASPAPDMRFQETSRDEAGLTTNFVIPGSRTVRPSVLRRRHLLASLDLTTVAFSYIVVPKQRAAAFLTVKVTNTSSVTLLNGEAGLTLDGTFIGSTSISRCSPGATFDLALGIDPSIQINYGKPIVKRSTTGLFSKEDSAIFTRAIFINNTKPTAVQLKVLDQIPVSEDERVKVDIILPKGLRPKGGPVTSGVGETKGDWGSGIAEMKKNGEISWDVTLNKGMGCKLVLEYEVKAPGGEGVEGA